MNWMFKAGTAYAKAMWHDFEKHVLHKEKKGHDDIWHKITKYLVVIPFEIILPVIILITLITCIMLIVPIAKLFGYDLSAVFANKQAALQAKLKPAMWIPGMNCLHSARQKWNSVAPAEQVYKELVAIVKKWEKSADKQGETYKIVEHTAKEMTLKVHCFSKLKWLDVLEVKVEVGPDMGGAVVNASSYSTGAAPLILPPYVGVFASAFLFWVPFVDFGSNKQRLEHLRSLLKVETEKEK